MTQSMKRNSRYELPNFPIQQRKQEVADYPKMILHTSVHQLMQYDMLKSTELLRRNFQRLSAKEEFEASYVVESFGFRIKNIPN